MDIGLKYTSSVVVGEDNLARTLGSGDMDVFATPAMIALMENAAMNAVSDSLAKGSSTVGTKIDVTHTRATAAGKLVKATATLTQVDGRRLVFSVIAQDDTGIIGEGNHERFIVDRERFLAGL